MDHDPILIATIAAGIGAAFVLGSLAVRLGLPPVVGYLVAGVVVGPFTPGYVADSGLASQLAELGIILLMFGVGLHFSLGDLVQVWRIVVPGAVIQTTITTIVGTLVGRAFGMATGNALVLGLALGVASTAVLLKGLEASDQLDSPEGKVAVGWLVVEDVSMVLALVLLPAIAPGLVASGTANPSASALAISVAIALGKVAAFIGLMFVVGRRFVPWALERVVRLGSRELFTLAVLVMALGIGTIAAELFGVSFALGAFFAGVVISESDLSRRAATEALPLQDAFAVLFFVSVGMLFDPKVLLQSSLEVLAVVAIVVVWKSVLAFALLRVLPAPSRTAPILGAALGQIGEFSFIVAALGVSLGLATPHTQALIVAAAIIAIVVNGPITKAVGRAVRNADRGAATAAADAYECDDLSGHVVLVGFGRVGGTVAQALDSAQATYVVVEEDEGRVDAVRARGGRAIQGDATRADVLHRAGIERARLIVITAPDPLRSRRIAELSRAANPAIALAVRTHSASEQAYVERFLGGPEHGQAVYAEREAALSLARYSLGVIATDA